MAGCSIREEGLRAAALPGRVAAADAVALDAGPQAHERVGYINQSVLGLALREQIFLRWKRPSAHCAAGQRTNTIIMAPKNSAGTSMLSCGDFAIGRSLSRPLRTTFEATLEGLPECLPI